MCRKIINAITALFVLCTISYGASTLFISPGSVVVPIVAAATGQAGGFVQQAPQVLGMGSCHFNIGGVPGAGTYIAFQEPAEHSTFLIGGIREDTYRIYRVILNGPNGSYTVAMANRYVDSLGNVKWDGSVYSNDGTPASCQNNINGVPMILAGSDYNCGASAPWGGTCNSAGGNVTLTVSP